MSTHIINWNIEKKVDNPQNIFGYIDMHTGTLDYISDRPISKDSKHPNFKTTTIIDSRRAKGFYPDESKRPYWTRVRVSKD